MMVKAFNKLLPEPPFFIIGTGRCGTQMLRHMLEKNIYVKVLPETHFIPTLYKKYKLRKISYDDYFEVIDNVYGARGNKWIKNILQTSKRNYTDFYWQFKTFSQYLGIEKNIIKHTEALFLYLHGKGFRFGDKTPSYGVHATLLKKLWKDSKFIFLTRDGVNTAESMTKHIAFVKNINGKVSPKNICLLKYRGKNLKYSEKKVSIKSALKYWELLAIETTNELSMLPKDDVLHIHYEDLLLSPKKELYKINKFLKLPHSRNWMMKASEIPHPFPEKNYINKFTEKDYLSYSKMVEEGMNITGYPYNIKVERGLINSIKEIYRGRRHYLRKVFMWKKLLSFFRNSDLLSVIRSKLYPS